MGVYAGGTSRTSSNKEWVEVEAGGGDGCGGGGVGVGVGAKNGWKL